MKKDNRFEIKKLPALSEVFIVNEGETSVSWAQLSNQQRETFELEIYSDRAAPRNVGSAHYDFYRKDGKLHASLKSQLDDPSITIAAHEGIIPLDLVWNPNKIDSETGEKGSWVSRQ